MMEDCTATTVISNLPCLWNDTQGQMNRMQHFPNEHWLKPETHRALMQPSALVKLLPFPAARIWHSSKSISPFMLVVVSVARFSVITIHLGLIKDEYCRITWKYLHDNTMWYYVRAAGSVLCFARMVQMQDFITSLFSRVSYDIGLIHRCNTNKIWITTQVVLQRSL